MLWEGDVSYGCLERAEVSSVTSNRDRERTKPIDTSRCGITQVKNYITEVAKLHLTRLHNVEDMSELYSSHCPIY